MQTRPVMRPRLVGRRVAVLAISLGLLGVLAPRQVAPATAVGSGDVTPPALTGALEWTGPDTPIQDVILIWNDLLDESLPLALGDFDVQFDDLDAELDPVSLALDSVEYTHGGYIDPASAATFMTVFLTAPVTGPGSLTVTYTPSVANPVKDVAGNVAGVALDVPVEVFEFADFGMVGAIVDGNYGRDHVGLIFSDEVDPGSITPASTAWFTVTLTRNGITAPMAPPTSVTIFPAFSGRIVDLELPEGFRSGDTATVTYDAPVTDGVKNLGGTAALDPLDGEVFLGLIAQDSVGGTTSAGSPSVTTDVGDPGPSAQDPIATSITPPLGATVLIDEGLTDYPPSVPEYTFIGETVEIVVNPPGTVEVPIIIDFTIDGSILAEAGATEMSVQILRNGLLVPNCTGPLGWASEDPCIASRTRVPDLPDPLAYAILRVHTSHASTWHFLARLPWAGFRQPVDDAPTVNLTKAGQTIPVKFTLGGDLGLAIFRAGYPASEPADCESGVATDSIEETTTAGSSSLSYAPGNGVYTYVWKTSKAWSSAPAGPCRRLILGFNDGSTREAVFRFR